jgi:hypothetical protein
VVAGLWDVVDDEDTDLVGHLALVSPWCGRLDGSVSPDRGGLRTVRSEPSPRRRVWFPGRTSGGGGLTVWPLSA